MTPQLLDLEGKPLSWAELHARCDAYYAPRYVVVDDTRRKYWPQERECPVCAAAFTWTASQQKTYTANARYRPIEALDLQPCCSRSCAIRQGWRTRREALRS